VQKIFLVWANSDSTEGRGTNRVFFYCSTRSAAEDLSKGLGPMGCSDGYIAEAWLVASKAEQIKSQSIENVKRQALSKLTDEEKKALDLI